MTGLEVLRFCQPLWREAQGNVLISDDPTKDFFDLGPFTIALQCFF